MVRRKGARVQESLQWTLLLVLMVFFTFPFFWMVLMSIKPPELSFAIPPAWFFKPTLASYQELLFGEQSGSLDFWKMGRNSVVAALGSTVVALSCAVLGAYSISRFYFRGRKSLSFLIIGTRMLPPIATAIPLFIFAFRLNLLDTHVMLILAYTGINIPFAIWMLRGFMDELPISLEDAARIDGCSRLGALWRIVLPLIAPGVGATGIFVFLNSWNDFALALLLTNRDAVTLPLLAMSFVTDEGIHWGPMSAAITLVSLPAILFVVLAQPTLAKGLTMGAVKG